MPLQANFVQASGAVPFYHVVTGVNNSFASDGSGACAAAAVVTSWVTKTAKAQGNPSMCTNVFDVSMLLTQSAPSPVGTVGQEMINNVELYLLNLPQFQGGSQTT